MVDSDGQLIYHADSTRVGENVMRNPVVAAVTQGHAGAQRVVNTKGVDMLAGYAANRSAAGASSRSGPPRSRCSPYMA